MIARASLAVLSLGVLSLDGCARNAFLELEVQVPANPFPEPRYAQIYVRSGSEEFGVDWLGENPIPSLALSNTPVSQRVSVEGTDENEQTRVRVKVRFCRNPNCVDPLDVNAPESWLEIERAFYVGKRTGFLWKIDCVPAAMGCDATVEPNKTVTTASKCQVTGCRPGVVTSNYCVGDKHFCEE